MTPLKKLLICLLVALSFAAVADTLHFVGDGENYGNSSYAKFLIPLKVRADYYLPWYIHYPIDLLLLTFLLPPLMGVVAFSGSAAYLWRERWIPGSFRRFFARHHTGNLILYLALSAGGAALSCIMNDNFASFPFLTAFFFLATPYESNLPLIGNPYSPLRRAARLIFFLLLLLVAGAAVMITVETENWIGLAVVTVVITAIANIVRHGVRRVINSLGVANIAALLIGLWGYAQRDTFETGFYAFAGLNILTTLMLWNSWDEYDPVWTSERVPVRGEGMTSIERAWQRLQELLAGDIRGVTFGPFPVPYGMETQHFLMVGSTGSGKTNYLKVLLATLAGRIGSPRYPNNRAVIVDPKREFSPILFYYTMREARGEGREHAPFVMLDLYHPSSEWWDIAQDINGRDDCVELAKILIPEQEGKSGRFWTDAPRALVTDVLDGLRLTCGKKWRLRDLVVIFQKPKLTQYFINQVPLPASEGMLDQNDTARGISYTVRTYINNLSPAAAAYDFLCISGGENRGISLNKFPETESLLLVVNDMQHVETVRPINNLILGKLASVLRSQPEVDAVPEEKKINAQGRVVDPRTFYIVDEAKSLGNIPGLRDLLTDGRSRGVSCVLSFPSPFGMYEVYGENGTKDIVSLCNCIGVFRSDRDAAKVISEWFSSVLTLDRTSSFNAQGERSVSESFGRDNVIEAKEISELAHVQTGAVESFWQYREIPPFKVSQDTEIFRDSVWNPQKNIGDQLQNQGWTKLIPPQLQHTTLRPFTKEDYRRLDIPYELWDLPGLTITSLETAPPKKSPTGGSPEQPPPPPPRKATVAEPEDLFGDLGRRKK